MVRHLVLAGLGLLGTCRAGDAELSALVAELQQMARRQQERIDTYDSLVEKQQAKVAPRQLRDESFLPSTIYSGSQQLSGTRTYRAVDANDLLLTHIWLLLCGALAVLMQAGFAVIEVGHGRVKNAQVILLKNLAVVAASCWGWWCFGWSFAYSGPLVYGYKENKFAGKEQFLGHHFMLVRQDGQIEPSSTMLRWFFNWPFCAAATVIASAGVSERISFLGSLIFAFLFSSFIYPIVVAWTWGNGWLADMNETGYMDFAGSGVVFLSGGTAALVGSMIAGRRTGRFEYLSGKERLVNWPRSFQPHSVPLVVMGTFIIWFGWYGLACGSTISMANIEKGMLAAQVAMNMTIAAAGSGMVVFLLRLAMCRKFDILMFCNGILAGLVSISAGCSTVECGSAVAIGIVGGILYYVTALVIRIAKIDDPVDAFAVYGVPGLWGVLAAALFDWGNSFSHVHGWQGFRCMADNFGNCRASLGGDLVAANCALIGAVFGWVAVLSAVVFLVLKVTKLLKNQTYADEESGAGEAGGAAYTYEEVYVNNSI